MFQFVSVVMDCYVVLVEGGEGRMNVLPVGIKYQQELTAKITVKGYSSFVVH